MYVALPCREAHRLAGLALAAPLALWIGTGLLFHLKPGWDEAYEALAAPPPGPLPWERVVFSPAAVKARGLLDPGPVRRAAPASSPGRQGRARPPPRPPRAFARRITLAPRRAPHHGQARAASSDLGREAGPRRPITGEVSQSGANERIDSSTGSTTSVDALEASPPRPPPLLVLSAGGLRLALTRPSRDSNGHPSSAP
ncbi:MAG: hypothetical protein IPL90_06570 [Holophagales bacterium]|nr:hypothetical protein [Holophagales bacterium]